MPYLNDKFKLTNFFLEQNIDELNIQEAPKFLLRCMKKISNNNIFIYKDLLNFMINNCDNEIYYKGERGISSKKNLKYYWKYALSTTHSANIPNFELYFYKILI